MARRVFFSFHFERDAWRASQVRNSWLTRDREAAGFWDVAAWESVKRRGDGAIRNWIDEQMRGASVTAVLVGAETADRRYVRYEIQKSHELGKGILGVRIHALKDRFRRAGVYGKDPFREVRVPGLIVDRSLAGLYPTYDWVLDSGYTNFGAWVEAAARAAGR